jgi:hypothetical protein
MTRLEEMKICQDKDGHFKRKCDIDKEEQVAQESKETKSNLQVKHQTLLLQDATIQCTEKLQLKDQEDSHIKKLEDKIAKLQQNKKDKYHNKSNNLNDLKGYVLQFEEVMEKDQKKCKQSRQSNK